MLNMSGVSGRSCLWSAKPLGMMSHASGRPAPGALTLEAKSPSSHTLTHLSHLAFMVRKQKDCFPKFPSGCGGGVLRIRLRSTEWPIRACGPSPAWAGMGVESQVLGSGTVSKKMSEAEAHGTGEYQAAARGGMALSVGNNLC